MLSVLALTSAGTVVAAPRVLAVFTANLWLNGFILFVFFIGVISCFVQVVQLIKSVRWIEEFVNKPDKGSAKAPQLLAPLATLLRSRGASIQISASSSQSILESVSTRVEEAREITRYIVNLLIFFSIPVSGQILKGRILDENYDFLEGMVKSDGYVGFRVPKLKFAINLMNLMKSPLTGTSANMSGQPETKDINVIKDSLNLKIIKKVVNISCGDEKSVSTVIKFSSNKIIKSRF